MKKQRRILIFATAYKPFIGGAEIAVEEIIKRTDDIGFDILTVNLDGKQKAKEAIGNTTIHRIDSSKLLFPIIAFLKANRLHKEKKFDAIWSVMASYAGFAGLFFSYRHPQLPFILTLQEGDTKEELKQKFWFVRPLFNKIFKRATIVQAISNYLAEFAREINPKAEVAVIPNGVDISKFRTNSPAKDPQKVSLITTSRLVKKNAVGDIIQSLDFLPENISLTVVGDGPLRSELESLAKDARVKFVGEVPHKKILSYLESADIFVRPSISEGFGNSFVEAMAAGLPVIATPVGGIVDFLEDEKTGFFCRVNDPEDLAQKVKKLIENPDLTEDIKQRAYQMVKERYDWDLIAQRMKKEVFDVVLE